MDWAKAKSIFIFVFIAFNIFLVGAIGLYRHEQRISREVLADTVEILEQRGVTLSPGLRLPDFKGSMRLLMYVSGKEDLLKIASGLCGQPLTEEDFPEGKYMSEDGGLLSLKSVYSLDYINSEPEGALNIIGRSEAEKSARAFLKGIGVKISNYVMDSYESYADGSCSLIFIEKYNGYYVYGNNIKITLTPKGVTRFQYQYKKIKKLSAEEPVEVMPIHQILLKEHGIGEGTVISAIDLGYKSPGEAEEKMTEYVESPAWRVSFKDGTYRYYEVQTGSEINR